MNQLAPLFFFLLLNLQPKTKCELYIQENIPLVCNVLDFGARGDFSALETHAIQSAIDLCSSRSSRGSVVHFPPGKYLTGTLFLRSNMNVSLDPGAIIFGSSKQVDYPAERSKWYVLLGESVENVGVTGGGALNGQSDKFVLRFNKRKNVMISWNTTGACLGDECRPRLLGFVNSKHIHVSGIHLEQPAYWGLHVANSSEISIQDLTMVGDFNTPNNDGIDIDGSNNTIISGCELNTGDDGIIAKSIAGPLFNLTVTSSWIRSKSCAVKIGSESYHDMSSLRFDNITIVDSHRGLGIQLRDTGSISDVTFSNVALSTRFYDPLWWGRAEPIYVTACPRNYTTAVGSMKLVSFINISGVSENGVFLSGSGGGLLSEVRLSNIRLELQRISNFSSLDQHDYRPGCRGLVPHQTSSGVFMEGVLQLTLGNVSMTLKSTGETQDWDVPLEFTPHTMKNISMINFSSIISWYSWMSRCGLP